MLGALSLRARISLYSSPSPKGLHMSIKSRLCIRSTLKQPSLRPFGRVPLRLVALPTADLVVASNLLPLGVSGVFVNRLVSRLNPCFRSILTAYFACKALQQSCSASELVPNSVTVNRICPCRVQT